MTIYRGPGGTGEARTDTDVTEVRIIADEAEGYKDAAAASAVAAASSASAAATSETNAQTAETNAETAETNAETAQVAAEVAQAAAEAAQLAAEAAQIAAELAETNAETAEANAETAETNAETAQAAAEAALASAQAVYDNFDDRYLGAKSSDPTLDNDGNALLIGALYFNTSIPEMRVYSSGGWINFAAGGAVTSFNTRTGAVTLSSSDVTTALGYTAGTVTSVGGTGTVNGLSLSGTVTSTGNLTLGGTLDLSSPPAIGGTTAAAGAFTTLAASGTTTLSGNQIISVTDNSNAALRITQLGTGNALLVEDSTNPDASPFVIDASGNVGIGTSSPAANLAIGPDNTNNGQAGYRTLLISDTSNGSQIVMRGLGPKLVYDITGTNDAEVYYDNRSYVIYSGVPNATPTERLRIDSSGNLGLGVTPSAWSTLRGFDIGTTGSLSSHSSGATDSAFVSGNAYFNGTNWIYKATSTATQYKMYGGVHSWYTAPSGTAGTAVTFTQAMTLNASGNLGIGTSSPGAKLDVNGGALIQGLTVGRGAGAVATNTAVGASALAANTTGSLNTAFGYNALTLAAANNNSAFGYNALSANTSGTPNSAFGRSALASNTTGTSNTGIGYGAVQSNTTGGYNVGVGHQSLVNNTTASNNTAVGYQAGYTNVTGASNTFIGYQSGYANTVSGNVFVGAFVGQNNSSGNANTAIGGANVGTTNTTFQANTTGAFNVAVGAAALQSNTTASNNTAVGYAALDANTTGTTNVAVGTNALGANTTANDNVAVGTGAMEDNTTGAQNTVVGRDALGSNTTASNNTAVGYQAGYGATTGGGNTFVGLSAGSNITTGQNGLFVGNTAQASSSSVNNELVIGSGATFTGKGASTGFITPNGGGVYQGNNSSSWSTTSDQRLKKNIVDNNTGLEKLTAIQVRNFEYRLPEEVDAELKPTDAIQKTGVQLGVIAQELQQVLPECVKTESTGVMSVDTDNLIWYAINAIKEQQAIITQLQADVAALKGN